MVIDISGAGQGQSRPERLDIEPVPRDGNRAHPERSETGQTSAAGPGVEASFSAAAMEMARPVAATEQTADMNRGDDLLEREDRGVAQVNREEQLRQAREPQRQTIDTKA